MFQLHLFKIRAFSVGLFASLLAALSRGGLMFMLIIWLQGIWLPLHGYTFERTPLWAGIAILPLTADSSSPGRFRGFSRTATAHGSSPAEAWSARLSASSSSNSYRWTSPTPLRHAAVPHGLVHGIVRLGQPFGGHQQHSR